MLRKFSLAASVVAAVAMSPAAAFAGPLTLHGNAPTSSGDGLVLQVKKGGKGGSGGMKKGGSGGKHHHHRRGRGTGVGVVLYAAGCTAVRSDCADSYGWRTRAFYRCVRSRGC
jgi:hypothetical protein